MPNMQVVARVDMSMTTKTNDISEVLFKQFEQITGTNNSATIKQHGATTMGHHEASAMQQALSSKHQATLSKHQASNIK